MIVAIVEADPFHRGLGILRRDFVGGLAIGALAALAPSALAQSVQADESMQGTGVAAGTPDYPGPPFQKQHQEWPGLASRMTPRPDHGEKTYRGSGRLAGRRALITGGDSGMGRAAAIAFAAGGRRCGDKLSAPGGIRMRRR